jgi:hypothetical protein
VDSAATERFNRLNRRRFYGQLFAYLLIVIIAIFGFYKNDQDNKARCEAGATSRQAQRDTINAVADLAVGLTRPPAGSVPPQRTDEEKLRYEQYIAKVEKFRSSTLAKVTSNPSCFKYGIKD